MNDDVPVSYDLMITPGYPCDEVFVYEGKFGCEFLDVSPLQSFQAGLGAVEILGGLLVCFMGSYLYLSALQLLVFLMVGGFTMAIGNGTMNFYTGSKGPIYTCLAIALVLASIASFLVSRL